MSQKLLPTTVVGSYPQPDWLVNREMLAKVVPRVRMTEIWRVADPYLEQAQDDATLVAIRDMERAGIDIITDGEMRRESYSNRFATALEGIDNDTPGEVQGRSGLTKVPRVVGKIRRNKPVELRDMQFLRHNTDLPAKITLPGPFTMSQQAVDEFYKDDEAMTMDFAVAVNAELRDLEAAGADVIQLDEPWLRNNPDKAKRYAVKAINRALEGIRVPTVVHLCFGYAAVVPGSSKPAGYAFLPQLADTTAQQISIESAQPKIDLGVLKELSGKKIMLGVIDLSDNAVETPETVAARIRRGLEVGYRHLDTAAHYGNERENGEALRASGVKREDVFITTKVRQDDAMPDDFARVVEQSLANLKLPQVDLLLIHWPSKSVPLKLTIGALCKAKKDGKTKHIGVSNFTTALLDEVWGVTTEPLVCNQIEAHPFINQDKVIVASQKRGMAVVAYVPIARGKVPGAEALERIGKAHRKSAAQVSLRYLVQRDLVAVPRSANREHLKANLDVFGFKLSEAEMAELKKLNATNMRVVNPPHAPMWDTV